MKKPAHSRYLLPAEILLGAISASLAVVGGFGSSMLHAVLHRLGDDVGWFVCFGFVGFVRVAISAFEWLYMRYASKETVLQFVSVRAGLAFVCLMTWAGALKVIVVAGLVPQMLFVVILAVLVMVFNVWSFWENLKVRYALNPHVYTPNLEYKVDRRV